MNTHSLTAKSVRNKLMVILLLTMPVFIFACGGPKHMITMDVKPPLAPKPGKALLVVARTTSRGFAITIENYLDGRMIGQTKGKSYFMTDVMPGPHYIMAHAENWAAARINFEANRMYFLEQGIYIGVMMARTGFSPLTAEEGIDQINERGCDYRVHNAEDPGENMSSTDFNDVRDDFEKEVKEDSARHKDTLEYRGYDKL